jgi:LAS superfamily LD-carboxypeptidase LdcB
MNFNSVTNSEIKKINRGYGMKMHPISKRMKMHHGIDIPVSTGHNIYAIADGVIVDSEIRKNSCGGTIKVDHGTIDGKELATRFCHCSQLLKKKGDVVKKGDVIAKSGGGKGDVGRGGSTGPHIHFEVYENGKTVDPMKYYSGGQTFQNQDSSSPIIPNNTTNEPTKDYKDDISKISTGNVQRELLKSLLGKIGWAGLVDLIPDSPGATSDNEKVELIKNKINDTSTNTNGLKTNGSEISKLPQKIQDAIQRLKSEYGITITDEHIKKEFNQEGNWREDAGGVNSEAKKQILKLISDAKTKFPKIGKLGIISDYRSYNDQVKNFGKKAKSRGIDNTQKANTVPGFSQHHTGKAFDIFSVDSGWWSSNSDVKNWVANNAKNYGFDVTYKTQGPLRIAEPWHLYYTGQNLKESEKKVLSILVEDINRIKKLMK